MLTLRGILNPPNCHLLINNWNKINVVINEVSNYGDFSVNKLGYNSIIAIAISFIRYSN